MSISYVNGLLGGADNTNASYTIDISGLGIQTGDVVVVNASNPGTGSPTISGDQTGTYSYAWSVLSHAAETRTHRSRAAYAIMGATPDTTLTISKLATAGNAASAAVMVFRGVDTTTPLDGVTTVTANNINGNGANPPAITPATAGAWVVGAYACGTDNTSGSVTAPANMTGFVGGRSSNAASTACAGLAYYSGWSSGAFNPDAWALANSWAQDAWTAGSLVLRAGATPQSGSISPATFTLTPVALGSSVGGVSKSISPSTFTLSPVALSRSVGDVSRSISPAIFTLAPTALTTSVDNAPASISPVVFTLAPQSILVIVSYTLTPVTFTLTPVALVRSLGTSYGYITDVTFSLTPRPLTRSVGAVSGSISPVVLSLTIVEISGPLANPISRFPKVMQVIQT